jgi:hypothetical protein
LNTAANETRVYRPSALGREVVDSPSALSAGVFVQHFGEISKPLARIADLLPEVMVRLDELGEDSYREGEELLVRIGHRQHHVVAAKTVRLQAGTPIRERSSIRIPLSWAATGTPRLFPKMTADLMMVPLGDQLTQIRFEGVYQPPLGAVGRMLDRAILHRVAEMSVKDLVDRIVAILEVDPGPGPPAASGEEE